MEIDSNEESQDLHLNREEDKIKRRKRRSSFIDKSRISYGNTAPENDENSVMNECNSKDKDKGSDNDWKKIYLRMLKDEKKEWQNTVWNMKYKYQETLKKSKKPRIIDDSCIKLLPPERVKFLNDAGVHKRVVKQLDTLIESTAINSKLRMMVFTATDKYIKKKLAPDLKKMRRKIYEETIETPFCNINIDDDGNDGERLESFLSNDTIMETL